MRPLRTPEQVLDYLWGQIRALDRLYLRHPVQSSDPRVVLQLCQSGLVAARNLVKAQRAEQEAAALRRHVTTLEDQRTPLEQEAAELRRYAATLEDQLASLEQRLGDSADEEPPTK